MSVFGNIMSAIFGHGAAPAQGTSTAAGAPTTSTAPSSAGTAAGPSAAPQAQVDVEAVLAKLATSKQREARLA